MGALADDPYSPSLEATAKLPSGERLRIRPIRPDDQTRLSEMAAHMTPEDLRLRFFAATKGLPADLAARMCHIDYAHEMALVAQRLQSDDILGVAGYSADKSNRDAEFAIAVRSDWKEHGVGWVLMEKLTNIARHRGIGTLSGLVLRSNGYMLQFCRDLGFVIAKNIGDDPQTVYVSLDLGSSPAGPRQVDPTSSRT